MTVGPLGIGTTPASAGVGPQHMESYNLVLTFRYDLALCIALTQRPQIQGSVKLPSLTAGFVRQ